LDVHAPWCAVEMTPEAEPSPARRWTGEPGHLAQARMEAVRRDDHLSIESAFGELEAGVAPRELHSLHLRTEEEPRACLGCSAPERLDQRGPPYAKSRIGGERRLDGGAVLLH